MNAIPLMFVEPAADNLRLSEVLGALSYALDLTEGQPQGHSLRCCWIGIHVGRELGMNADEQWDLYYTLLLKDAGCSSNAERLCELYGHDDIETKRNFKLVNTDRINQLARFVFKHTAPGRGLSQRVQHLLRLIMKGEELATELIATRCERGAQIAKKLGFNECVAAGVHSLDEHWNGQGRPERLTGEDIPMGSRIALLSQVADVFHQIGGADSALYELRERNGTWFDPQVVTAFERIARNRDFWAALSDPALPERVFAMEPANHVTYLNEERLDDIAAAFAQVVDAKSHFTYGHSERVAKYSEQLAEHLGLSKTRRRWLWRGALLHDMGKLGVSNAVLDKPGQLDSAEWDSVRTHPRLTQEILSHITPFRDLAQVAGAHHERLDGKGYPAGISSNDISIETRIITTCDIFDAITADRPYRAAIPVDEALRIMNKLRGHSLDDDCLDALIQCLPQFDIK